MTIVDLNAAAPALWGKLVLLGSAALLLAFAVGFRRRQKPGEIGGPISWPKALWLSLAIWFWFVVCGVLGFDHALPDSIADVFAACAISMWLRGAVEMFMLYVTHNWRPPMGIAHDVFTIGVVLAVGLVGIDSETLHTASTFSLAALGVAGILVVSLVIEIVHAWTFFLVVGKRTMGDDGVWFADDEDPRFVAINQRTRIGNVLVGVPVFAFVVWWVLR
jgi:hypothetical protein